MYLRRLNTFCFLVLCLSFVVSCSGSGGDSNPQSTVILRSEKIATIGNISGPLADEIQQIFVNCVPYDGLFVDAPIFIAAQSLQSLTPAQQNGIRQTYANLFPIVLVHGSEAEINILLGILGLEQNYTLPKGLPEDKPYAELFAVDLEANGYTYTWSMYPPREGIPTSTEAGAPMPTPYTDGHDDQLRRTAVFRQWIDQDGTRVTQEESAKTQEARQVLAAKIAAANQELTEIAKGYVTTKNFTDRGNNYQITYKIYSCHSFDAEHLDYDWFYVTQDGLLNASNAYKGVNNPAWPNPGTVSYYIGSYKMNNWMQGMTSEGAGVVLIPPASPQNANNTETVTSGVSFNIGGSLGFNGTNATGSLNAGVTITNSKSITVSDCTVVNNSGDSINNAKWSYEFKRAPQIVYFDYTTFEEPPRLTRATFQPSNQWIWQFSPAVRTANKKTFFSQFDVQLIGSEGGQARTFWVADPPTHNKYDSSWNFEVSLPFPPLLVAPHNLDFLTTPDAETQALDLAVARDWTASCSEAWCHVTPTGSSTHLFVTVDRNTTKGLPRAAVITFKTKEGNGLDTTTVTQAPCTAQYNFCTQ